MKIVYNNLRTWTLGVALCCVTSVVSFATAEAAPGGAPANDLCSNAETITCGDALAGSTVNGTQQTIDGSAGIGVWYTFTGSGGTVSLTTCDNADFDTEITVMTSPDCSSFTQVAQNDDDFSCSGNTSTVTFVTTSGETYYVYVSHYLSGSSTTGNFTLTMSCPPPANDLCVDAETLNCGDVVAGTTINGTQQTIDGSAGIGVWYTFTGTGGDVLLTTCDDANFDTEITVMTSPDCSSFTQVAQNDDDSNCSGNTSTVQFTTTSGETYYAYVSHYLSGSSTTGSFNLTFDCVPPANDLCADAEEISCGDVVAGNTIGGTQQAIDGSAGIGVWYTFTGTGDDITLTTCDDADFDTEITVMTSPDCSSFTQIAQNDDDSNCTGNTSTVTFTSTYGETYFAYVSHYLSGSSTTGNFNLTMTCAAPANDLCAGAVSVVCGETVSGITSAATADAAVGTCTTDLTAGPGVWYSYVGTGQDVSVTTCNPATDFDTKLGVFSGDCNALVCVGGNDDAAGAPVECQLPPNNFNRKSTVEFYAEPGVTYYFYVTGFLEAAGAFDLSVSCVCPTIDAGTLTADATPVCMSGGSATISATEGTAPTVPAGYTVAYVLTSGAGLDILGADVTPSFSVNTAGDYTIHTLVANPADQATLLAETTGGGVAALLSGNGGTPLCGALDVTGAPITVNPEPTATLSGGGIACDGGTVDVEIAFTGTGPWDVNYTDPVGVVDLTGVTDNPLVIAASAAGSFTLNSVSDANCPGTVSGTATVTEETTAESVWSSAQVAGTLDVDFTDASLNSPTSWLWDFGDGNTSTAASPTHTYAADGTYTVCLTVTNDCGSDSSCAAVVVLPPPPANDLCSGAVSVTCGSTTSGTTVGSTAADAPFGTDYVSEGVWYVFAGTGDDVTASTCDAADFDTEIVIASGSCGNLTYVNNNDDDFTNCTGNTSQVTFPTQVGVDYYIYVGDYFGTDVGPNGNEGTFDLSITCVTPPPAPANDDVCAPEALSMGVNTGYTNESATAQVGESVPGAGTGGSTCQSQDGWCSFELDLDNTVWFTFDAPASGNVIVSTDNSDFDTQLAVYSAVSCQDLLSGTAVLEGANDDNPDATVANTSEVILCGLTPNETYFVQVDGYAGASGDLTLTLTETTLTADFTYSATGLSVEFTDASTASGTITDWAWDFGDGNTADVEGPVTNAYATDGPYTVCLTVTDDNGCTSEYCEAIQVTDITISIAEAVDRAMAVYPNPSNGEFVVEIRGVETNIQLNVLDLAGRIVYTEGAVLNGDFRKDLNLDVASGTYLLQIGTEEGLVTRKIQIH